MKIDIKNTDKMKKTFDLWKNSVKLCCHRRSYMKLSVSFMSNVIGILAILLYTLNLQIGDLTKKCCNRTDQ